jgi:cellobiose PTS system EIIC component
MDAKGLFLGIVLTIFVVHLFRKLSTSEKLKISMPEGVPPAVGRAFSKLLPTIIVALSVAGIFALVAIPSYLATPKIFAFHQVGDDKVLG